MATEQDTRPGNVRLRLQTDAQRWVTVGPFQSLGGARRLAEDLISEQTVQAVRVEHRNRGLWKPAWSWLAGVSLLLLVSLAPSPAQAMCVGTGPVYENCRAIQNQIEDMERQRQNDEQRRRNEEENRRQQEQAERASHDLFCRLNPSNIVCQVPR